MKRTTSTFFNDNTPKKLKPIQLITIIDNDYMNFSGRNASADSVSDSPGDVSYESLEKAFDNYRLISRGKRYDIIAAWDNDSNTEEEVSVFAGYWNDGVLPSA